ncbi:cell envelope integrity protein TolA [Bradyrhizobium sp. UFLA05-112]
MKVKVDKTVVASIVLHVLVIGWGLISFSSRALEIPEESVIPVDISLDQPAKATAGVQTAEKDKQKPKVDKVAPEVTPPEESQGKITTKKELIQTNTTPPPPKPVEKPVEKKPDPPKPVQESKTKEESKPADKKPEEKVDPIAEALNKPEKEKKPPPPKQEAAKPQPPKPKDRPFNPMDIMAKLEDKRDPTRHEMTGATPNATSALGTQNGKDTAIVATWKGAFVAAVRRCFRFPYNGQDADQFEVDIDIQMRPDGTVASSPVIVAVRGPSRSVGTAMAESAKRAVEECQAYAFLPKSQYDTWKYIPMTFGLKDML